MGACLAGCLPRSEALRGFNVLDNQSAPVDFKFLIQENEVAPEENKCGFLCRLFKKRSKKKPVRQLVDNLLNPQVSSYTRLSESQRLSSIGSCMSRDIQLQCLDARALLQRTATSTPGSSLDLEWEHETLPLSMVHDPSGSSWTAVADEFSSDARCPSASSQADWSRVSSANSLEWDNVPEVDADTQLLLCEIERLTTKTLEETGRDLFS